MTVFLNPGRARWVEDEGKRTKTHLSLTRGDSRAIIIALVSGKLEGNVFGVSLGNGNSAYLSTFNEILWKRSAFESNAGCSVRLL